MAALLRGESYQPPADSATRSSTGLRRPACKAGGGSPFSAPTRPPAHPLAPGRHAARSRRWELPARHDVLQPPEDRARSRRLPAWLPALHPEPRRRTGLLAAVAHRASRPRSARRQLPAARGGHEGGGQGTAERAARRGAAGAAAGQHLLSDAHRAARPEPHPAAPARPRPARGRARRDPPPGGVGGPDEPAGHRPRLHPRRADHADPVAGRAQ